MSGEDLKVSDAIEAGAVSLFLSSPAFLAQKIAWTWLTPAIRNRWRRRFTEAVAAADAAGDLYKEPTNNEAK